MVPAFSLAVYERLQFLLAVRCFLPPNVCCQVDVSVRHSVFEALSYTLVNSFSSIVYIHHLLSAWRKLMLQTV